MAKGRKAKRSLNSLAEPDVLSLIPPGRNPADFELRTFEITEEPIPDPSYEHLPKSVRERLAEYGEGIYLYKPKELNAAIEELERLKTRYPKARLIRNQLSGAYAAAGDRERARALVVDTYRDFPDYLFARINYAKVLIHEGEVARIPALFDHKFDLMSFYPSRSRFHITEFIGFYNVMGLYYARTGQRAEAQRMLELLESAIKKHPLVRELRYELHPTPLQCLLKPVVRWLGTKAEKGKPS